MLVLWAQVKSSCLKNKLITVVHSSQTLSLLSRSSGREGLVKGKGAGEKVTARVLGKVTARAPGKVMARAPGKETKLGKLTYYHTP